MPTADRLQQAEQQFSAGDTVAAVRLLRDERLAAGAHRDILTLRRIVALARIESGFPGTAAGLIYAAQGDLSYAESQEEIARANLAEARASVEAGNDRAASVALERALRKELRSGRSNEIATSWRRSPTLRARSLPGAGEGRGSVSTESSKAHGSPFRPQRRRPRCTRSPSLNPPRLP